MASGRQRVLYIAGWGRSGSTLLASILGQYDGAFAAGELRSLWARGMLEHRLCGCREPVPECPLWKDVIATARFTLPAAEMASIQATHLRTRDYPQAWVRLLARRDVDSQMQAYVETYAAAHSAVGEVTKAEVIVDSSGYPLDAILLARGGVDLSVIHLVRDPRPVASAWATQRPLDDTADGAESTFRQLNPAGSSTIWSLWNSMITGPLARAVGAGRTFRLRYEDLIADPAGAVEAMARFAGLDPASTPVHGRVADLAPSHLVAGNRSRFATGPVEIRRDVDATLSAAGNVLATIPALPLLRRYGYPIRWSSTHRGG